MRSLLALIDPMRTGIPNTCEASRSITGRHSSIRGRIQPCSAPQASAKSSQKTTRVHHKLLATALSTRSGREGGKESFMETRTWLEL